MIENYTKRKVLTVGSSLRARRNQEREIINPPHRTRKCVNKTPSSTEKEIITYEIESAKYNFHDVEHGEKKCRDRKKQFHERGSGAGGVRST
jgi:hypothetical protein